MKYFSFLTISLLALCSCNSTKVSNDCKGTPKTDCMCTMEYRPVCGCDGKTYGNACEAKCAGVKSWTEGACGK